jgi:hypothetical protein
VLQLGIIIFILKVIASGSFEHFKGDASFYRDREASNAYSFSMLFALFRTGVCPRETAF